MDVIATTRDGVEIRGTLVAAADAHAMWSEHVRGFPQSGMWPLLLGNEPPNYGYDEYQRWRDDAAGAYALSAQAILEAARDLDGAEVVEATWEEEREFAAEAGEPFPWPQLDDARPDDSVRPVRLTVVSSSGEVPLALIPVNSSEEVPAIIGWGNWNACPAAETHVAMLRHWRKAYGAEPFAMSPDTLALVVSRPPRDFDAAVVLAREQYAYTHDIIDQGEHATVGELAQALIDCEHWQFWWD